MADEEPFPDSAEQPESPGGTPGSGSRSGRPWWSGTPKEIAAGTDAVTSTNPPAPGQATGAPPPSGGTWQDRREPILQAIDIRIEPLQRLITRTLEDLTAARSVLDGFAQSATSALHSLAAAAESVRSEARGHDADNATRAQAVTNRLDEVGAQLATSAREAHDRAAAQRGEIDERATAQLKEIDERATAALAALQQQQDRVASGVDELHTAFGALSGRLGALVGDLEHHLSALEQSLAGRLAGATDELRTEMAGTSEAASRALREEISRLTESLGADIAATSQSVRADLQAVSESLRRGIAENLAGTPTPEDLDALRSGVQEAAGRASSVAVAAHERIEALLTQSEQAIEQTQTRTDGLVDRVAHASQTLDSGFARVDRLASIIESLGRRRGFQELVSSEERLREEQATFVRDLAGASERVAERVEALAHHMEDLERRLEAAMAEAGALRTLPENVSGILSVQVERLRERLEKALDARFARGVQDSTKQLRAELEQGVPVSDTLRELRALVNTQQELARAQERAEQAGSALREELAALRNRIESWGRPGSAPRLAQEVQDLEGRVGEMEERLASSLPEEIAKRVTSDVLAALESKRRGGWRR
jgi:hypothetical protein